VVDRSIVRSRDGVRTVAISLAALGVAALAQAIVFFATNSVALLADLIHNAGDALTAVLLGIAFYVLGLPRADPVIGLVITVVILRITWDAWRTIRAGAA
jgi:divalent metal cation (Fe/Co/Zn/Cd) transporter